jgi:phage-related protein
MGLFGNVIKGALNIAISPIVLVTDTVTGDFENSSKIVENVIDSIDEGVEDLSNGDIL